MLESAPPGHAAEEAEQRWRIMRTAHAATRAPDGRFRVPCVRASLASKGAFTFTATRWWPIIGPWHEDEALLDFPTWHFHIDWRFVDAKTRTAVSRQLDPSHAGSEIAQVIIARDIVPLGTVPPKHNTWWTVRADQRKGERGFALPEDACERWFRHERRTPEPDPPPKWWRQTHWRPELEEAFEGRRLVGPERRCPHRGVPLAGIEADAEGVLECPLHGLRWRACDGRHVPDPWPPA